MVVCKVINGFHFTLMRISSVFNFCCPLTCLLSVYWLSVVTIRFTALHLNYNCQLKLSLLLADRCCTVRFPRPYSDLYYPSLQAAPLTSEDEGLVHPGLVLKYSTYKNLAAIASQNDRPERALDYYLEVRHGVYYWRMMIHILLWQYILIAHLTPGLMTF